MQVGFSRGATSLHLRHANSVSVLSMKKDAWQTSAQNRNTKRSSACYLPSRANRIKVSDNSGSAHSSTFIRQENKPHLFQHSCFTVSFLFSCAIKNEEQASASQPGLFRMLEGKVNKRQASFTQLQGKKTGKTKSVTVNHSGGWSERRQESCRRQRWVATTEERVKWLEPLLVVSLQQNCDT